MVGALQTMVTRRVSAFDPAVLTVAHISAGTTTNVIPETATLEGTVRTLSEETRARVLDEVTRVCSRRGRRLRLHLRGRDRAGYPVTVNDPDVADRVADAGRSVLGSRFVELMPDPIMGSEDFSYVLGRVPGALAFLGACPADVDPAEAPQPLEPRRVRRGRHGRGGRPVLGVRPGRPPAGLSVRAAPVRAHLPHSPGSS